MSTDIFLSIVIPAYNEERRLRQTLEDVRKYLQYQLWQAEVILVSDGSTDATVAVARACAQELPQLRIIENKVNQGKGAVVKQGMLAAMGELRLFMDADNATRVSEVEKLMPFIGDEAASKFSVVIGSIGVKEAAITKGESAPRMHAGKFGNMLVRLLLLPGIYDTQRGFKLFTAKSAEQIFSQLATTRWGFDMEALALALKMGYRIKEVPIEWHHMAESKVTFFTYFHVLIELLQIKFRLSRFQ